MTIMEWKKVSEKMPEAGERIFFFSDMFGVQMGWLRKWGEFEG